MPRTAGPTDEYDDYKAHISTQPHDVLLGWVLVCGLALAVLFGFWNFAPLPADSGNATQSAVKPDGFDLPLIQKEEEALADELRMTPRRGE
jgi:hypothetical protein